MSRASTSSPVRHHGPRRAAVVSTPVLLGALILVATGLGMLGSNVLERTLLIALINLLFVIALYIFIGNSGVFSFGHMSFMAVGAYTAGLLTIEPEKKKVLIEGVPGWIADVHMTPLHATLIGGLAAGVFGVLVSIPLARMSGIAATISSFAILVIVYSVASHLNQFTNGVRGMDGIPTTTTIRDGLVWSLIVLVVAFLFQVSRWGFRLRASREDEVAAQAIGIGIRNERRIALVVSAFFFGVGGALYAQFLGVITPETFFVNGTFTVVLMLVVGGLTSLSGAVIGSIAISVVAETLRRVEEGFSVGFVTVGDHPGLREVGLAVVLLLILLLRPDGLLGGRELMLPIGRHPRPVAAEEPLTEPSA